MEHLANDIPSDLVNFRVCDLWAEGLGWDMGRITPFLPQFYILQLLAVVVDNVTGAKDRISWGPSPDGRFTVSSASRFLTQNDLPRPNMSSFYDKIWTLKVPERVRAFFWLTSHKALMTNSERQRRHLSDSGLCEVCKSGDETILHVLRDCPAMSGIWNRSIPPSRRRLFFKQSLFDWIYTNLGDMEMCYGVPWATLFGIATWWGWKWRCGNVFGENAKCRDKVRFVKDLAQGVHQATSKQGRCTQGAMRVERHIAWTKPTEGWFKLNTDRASRGNPGLAAAGGVIRDEEGQWVQGFGLNIGSCTAPLAELWGVYYGLGLAWQKEITRLEIEVDSEVVVEFLKTGISDTHPLSFLVRLCYGFLSKDWQVRISHIYREANKLADGLANAAFSDPLGLHVFDFCPEVVRLMLLEDDKGSTYPRYVRM